MNDRPFLIQKAHLLVLLPSILSFILTDTYITLYKVSDLNLSIVLNKSIIDKNESKKHYLVSQGYDPQSFIKQEAL